jgi:hypothetical protein
MDSTTNASAEDMDVEKSIIAEDRAVARLYVRKAVNNIDNILDERKEKIVCITTMPGILEY